MSTNPTGAPRPLRDQIVAFLRQRDEATAKEIIAATTEAAYPSRVMNELNKLRTDAVVECEVKGKKKGNGALWYWLAMPANTAAIGGDSQPAVEQNTGSSALDDDSSSAQGAAVQPETAPVAAASTSAAPVAADEMQDDDEMPPADASLLALANRELADRLARVAHVLRGSGLEGLQDLDDGADLQSAAAALTGAYQMALAELFKQAIVVMDLRKQLEGLQREGMHGATLLSGEDRYTAAGYLVRAPKRAPRITAKQETAVAAALAAARNGSGRGEVFALVPVGKAVRGAEWRAA
jgi:hypothetical protein